MGKKKAKGEYNDFLDGEKLRDNISVRTTLQGPSSSTRDISSPPTRRDKNGRQAKKGRGGAPKKPPLTHFLCLPLVNEKSRPQLDAGLEKLKQDLGSTGLVSLKAVRPVGTLHLTLGVMSLDDEGLEGAKKCLEEIDLQSLLVGPEAVEGANKDESPLKIDLKSLVPMQAPHKTSILYAEPSDASQRLYPFGSALRAHFTAKGFLLEDKRPLKLHATIINTIYAKPRGRDQKKGRRPEPLSTQKSTELAHTDDAASVTGSLNQPDETETTAPLDPSTAETVAKAGEESIDGSEGHGPDAKSWMRFDATDLIERYKELVWAEGVVIDRATICKMGAKKVLGEDGVVVGEEYETVAEKMI